MWLLQLNKMPASSLMLIWRLAQDIQMKHYLCIEKCCWKMRVKRPGGHLKCFILYVSFPARDAQQRIRSTFAPTVFLAHFKTYVLYFATCRDAVERQPICDCSVNIWNIDVIERQMASSWMLHAENDRHLLACFSALLSSQMTLCTLGWLLM